MRLPNEWDRFGDPGYTERRFVAEDAEYRRRHERRVLGNFLFATRRQSHELAQVMQESNGGAFLHGVDPASEIVSWRR